MSEIYISTDIETDGPIPGPNSMLSLGAAAFSAVNHKMLGTFSVNFDPLEGAVGNPETLQWWSTQPEAWKAATENPQPPQKAMENYVSWVKSFNGRPVFVGYPAGFDFLFVYWYLIKFLGQSPFSFSAIDIKTYAMAVMQTDYRNSTKKQMPRHWFKNLPKHTHKAVDDAIEQGMLFCNIVKDNYNLNERFDRK